MDADEIAATVMSDESRVLKQIQMGEANAVGNMFMKLMGESVEPRRKFIEERALEANVDV